jgi:DNA-binding MarR family transcriptional regulator
MNNMNDNRQELLQILIERFMEAAQSMHANQNFPFGNFVLGRQQLMILFFVFKKEGLASVKEIAKFLRVTPGAVTQFINALVIKGLVKREENITDRRSVYIKLTDLSKKKFDDFRRSYLISAGQVFSDLSIQDLKKLTSLLSKIKKISD